MKEVVVISGKGGTGKTSIVASFAVLAEKTILAAGDVDAADLHLVLTPDVGSRHELKASREARIDETACTECGKCRELCRFDAIDENYAVDGISCEGCGVCVEFCPAGAIELRERISGEWFVSDTRCGPMVHARLGIAEENSGKLVTIVRSKAREIAEEKGLDYVIVDGPPGIGCPVIASLSGADMAVIVTEPTVSGQHDFERVADVARHFGIPAAVCINKADLNPDLAARIAKSAETKGLLVLGQVCYDDAVTRAQVAGQAVVEYNNSRSAEDIRALWRDVTKALDKGEGHA